MDTCNWSCLLNSFYKKTTPNPHLHLHVRPRYKNPVSLNGIQYIDEEFGHHYNPRKRNSLDTEGRKTLYEMLKKGLEE